MNKSVDLVIVDDDPFIGKFFANWLKEYNITFQFYADPEEGLASIVESRPKMIILDYNMPEINGQQLIVKLSEEHIFSDSSVFLLTAEKMDELQVMKMMTLGFEKVLFKPLDRNDFFTLLSDNLGELKSKTA